MFSVALGSRRQLNLACLVPLSRGSGGRAMQVFPAIPELQSEVVASPTVAGALTSLLGPGWCQHPHRTLHNYGKANGHNLEESPGSDQVRLASRRVDTCSARQA